jgi:hypothetical protein
MFVIATLLIPFAVTMVPLYLLWNYLDQTNTYYPLIVPAWLASPFSIFLLRQFFKMGYASAMAWILFLIIFACTFVVFRTSARWVFYGGETR